MASFVFGGFVLYLIIEFYYSNLDEEEYDEFLENSDSYYIEKQKLPVIAQGGTLYYRLHKRIQLQDELCC